MRRHGHDSKTLESRLRSVRNTALAAGVIGAASLTEVQSPGLAAATFFSLYGAGTFEGLRFIASPESERKRRIMGVIGKCAATMSFYVAATFPIEAVTLVAEDTRPIPVGLVNVRNFITQDDNWLPHGGAETAGYATADGAVALLAVAQGLSMWRLKDQQQLNSRQGQEVVG